VEKGTIIYCWWECKLVKPQCKTVWKLLNKLKTELLYDPAIPLLMMYPKECESGYNNDNCTPMFIAVLFTIAKYGNSQDLPLLRNGLKT
jgi:hypothetical protein